MLVSRIAAGKNGKHYLEVDGYPFFYQAVQAMYYEEGGMEKLVKDAKELHYPCFSVWLYWRLLEPVQGQYDWTSVDELISFAVKHDIRLDIVWGGTMFCDHMDDRFAPTWVYGDPQYHLKDENGVPYVLDASDRPPSPAADPCCRKLLEAEKSIFKALLAHLAEYDTTHRVVFFQVGNEINLNGYWGGKTNVLNYINQLCGVFEENEYHIATRVNIAKYQMDAEIDALPYIMAQGVDCYTTNVWIIRMSMLDPNCTKMKYIAENAAYFNSTALMTAAFAAGGFFNTYRIDYDFYWKKPGFYDERGLLTPGAVKVRQMNEAYGKIGELIAMAAPNEMVDFNNETGKQPFNDYRENKMLGGYGIGMCCNSSDAVGLALCYEGSFYCVADSDAWFMVFNYPIVCEEGEFVNGQWKCNSVKEAVKWQVNWQDDDFVVPYAAGEALKITISGKRDPIVPLTYEEYNKTKENDK